jgi:hypothetical protein
MVLVHRQINFDTACLWTEPAGSTAVFGFFRSAVTVRVRVHHPPEPRNQTADVTTRVEAVIRASRSVTL